MRGLQNGKTSRLVRFAFSTPSILSGVLYFIFSIFTLTVLQIQWLGRWERTIEPIIGMISVFILDRHIIGISEKAKQVDSILQENIKVRHERDCALEKLKKYENE